MVSNICCCAFWKPGEKLQVEARAFHLFCTCTRTGYNLLLWQMACRSIIYGLSLDTVFFPLFATHISSSSVTRLYMFIPEFLHLYYVPQSFLVLPSLLLCANRPRCMERMIHSQEKFSYPLWTLPEQQCQRYLFYKRRASNLKWPPLFPSTCIFCLISPQGVRFVSYNDAGTQPPSFF